MYECKSGQSRIGRFGAGSDKARSGKTKPDQEAGLIGPDQAKTKKSCPTHCRLHCYEPELKRLITRGPGSTQMSALGPHIAQTISSIPSTLNPPSTFDAANTSNISKTSHTHTPTHTPSISCADVIPAVGIEPTSPPGLHDTQRAHGEMDGGILTIRPSRQCRLFYVVARGFVQCCANGDTRRDCMLCCLSPGWALH